jgi:type VI secretion system protein ImpC
VHITYDVEIGDAIEQRELPLVVAILSDLSGKPKEALPPIKERSFVEVDRDNINEVMQGCNVRLAFKVKNAVVADGSDTNLELLFESIDDFSPLNLALQIPITAALYKGRCHLRDFLGKLDGNDPLDGLLDTLLSDEALQTELVGAFDGEEDHSTVEPTEFIQRMLEEGAMALDKTQQPYAMQLIGQFTMDLLKDT